ncbi:TetR/AcrR family transcriptional regulator [Peteryoungia desertarenae]|uniref:TetR/AcrR family transcriptional regulator n=1 Tax=Peteryoungia desertarenae TaxID=1813451 RepID=A0ABX6QNQ5_9HYPH|nr:TetR/AcrR family transcriptional regulator [Peteryoungia desertarenae]QLF69931.1 TetR/AcrR family transcriptional regulator [Peteryoungia desertarenae]
MTRKTILHPDRGDARERLLNAALSVIRSKGYAATTVDDLCRMATVSKGAFFHHFRSKEELAIAAAAHWHNETEAIFGRAPYRKQSNPQQRVLGYLAFRKELVVGDASEFSCLLGTMAQEVHQTSPAIRDACGEAIEAHASTLHDDIAEALANSINKDVCAPASLALHIQAVLQGAFIMAKAIGEPRVATDSIEHLIRYCTLLLEPAKQD